MSNNKIGFIPLVSIIIGNIVGSGVLLLPRTLSKFGVLSLWSYAISAMGLLSIGLMYAKMQIWLKCEGVHGPILKVFGHKYGRVAAFLYWISVVAGNSAMLTSLFSYLGFVHISFMMCFLLSSFFLSLITLFNCIDIRMIKIVEVVVAVVKVVPLIGLPLFCAYKAFLSDIDIYKVYETISFNSGIAQTLPQTLWAFLGIETAVVVGSRVYRPERTIPRAMIFSTIIITFIYILGMWTMMKLLPDLSNSTAPYSDLLKFIVPNSLKAFASPFITGLAVFLIIGSIYGWVFTTGVIMSDSSKQGLFPSIFKQNNRFGAPVKALTISSILSVMFLLLTHQENLAAHFNTMINFLTLVTFCIYFMTNIAFLKTIFNRKITFSNIFIALTSFISTISAIIIIANNILY